MGRLVGGAAVSAFALALLGGCGQDTGYLYEKRTLANEVDPGQPIDFDLDEEALYTNLTWLNDCNATDQIARPTPSRGQLIVENAGPHSIYRERMFNVPVTIKGKVCQPRGYYRDMVLMIDVTGSESIIDPLTNGTCRRFQALTQVLDTLSANDKFAVLTFEETVVKSSSQFFGTRAQLYADLTGLANPTDRNVADVVCAFGGYGNYNEAFARGKALLESGRGNETKKEIVLIADGFGNATIPQDQARAIAADLTTGGVVIAGGQHIVASIATLHVSSTVPGSGDGQFVHSFATRDRSGAALSGDVAVATQVAQAVGSIAINVITGNHFRIRPIGGTTWQDFDAMPHMTGREFTLPDFTLPIDLQQTGFEMELENWDTHNNRLSYSGQIVWAD